MSAWVDATRRLLGPEVSVARGTERFLVNTDDWIEFCNAHLHCGGDVETLVLWDRPVVRSTDIPRGFVAICLPSAYTTRSSLDS